MKKFILPFLLLLLLIPTSLSGGISSQSIFLNQLNLIEQNCPTFLTNEQCVPLLTFEVQFDSGLDFGEYLSLVGVLYSEHKFELIHMAPLNEPFDRARPNMAYCSFVHVNTDTWDRVKSPKEDLDGITYIIQKPVPARTFFRLVFEFKENGGNGENSKNRFCLGLLTLSRNRQLIDSNECLYSIRFSDLVAMTRVNVETTEKLEMADAATWSSVFDSTNNNKVTVTLLSSTINWDLGYAVDFKFPDAFTIPLTYLENRQIIVEVTDDVAPTPTPPVPTWKQLPFESYHYEFTADGYHRFLLPPSDSAKGLLGISDSVAYDVNGVKAAVRFTFLLQNKKPSYVNFDKVYFKVVIPNINKIVKYGELKWADAAKQINYGLVSYGNVQYTVLWGLKASYAVSFAGNTQSLCATYALFSISNTAMFWNSLKFVYTVDGISSFQERDYLTLLISETTTTKLGKKFILKGSVKHNFPLKSNFVMSYPGTDDILEITKILDLPANDYFVSFKLYVVPIASPPVSNYMIITAKISEGTSATPVFIRGYTSDVNFAAPRPELNKNLASFGGSRVFTYLDNPLLSEIKFVRSNTVAVASAALSELWVKLDKKALSIPKISLTTSTECHSLFVYLAIDYSVGDKALLDQHIKFILMYNPKILQVESPESGVILVGAMFAVVNTEYGIDIDAFRGVDFEGNAASPALQWNAIYFSSEKKIATAQLICKPSSATDVGCTKITDYKEKKLISGIAFYKAKIVGYPTQYADANVFDFLYCIFAAGAGSTTDPSITTEFTHASTIGFNEVVLTGIASNSGASAVAAPYFTSGSVNYLLEFYYLRMDAFLNAPIYSPAKVSFFSHEFTGVSLYSFRNNRIIDFQENKLVDYSSSDGIIKSTITGLDLYKFLNGADLSSYELWYTQGAVSFQKTGMISRVNVYLPMRASAPGADGIALNSIKTLNVVIHDDNNVFAVYRILGTVRIGGKVSWIKPTDTAKVDLFNSEGYCGASSLEETKAVEIIDYKSLPTKFTPDIVIKTGLGSGCNIKAGNKGSIKGVAFLAVTEFDLIDYIAPITWDHEAQNKDNKCFYHTLHTINPFYDSLAVLKENRVLVIYRYIVLCQTDSYPDADFGNPTKSLRMKLKPTNNYIYRADRKELITYLWSNEEGKRIYQMSDNREPVPEWKPTCQSEIEFGWNKTSTLATSYKIVHNSVKLTIKNKRRYIFKGTSALPEEKQLRIQIEDLPAAYNLIVACEHEILLCQFYQLPYLGDPSLTPVIPPGGILNLWYSGFQDYVVEPEKLIVNLIVAGSSTLASFSAADVIITGTPLKILQSDFEINADGVPIFQWFEQEISTLKIKNTDISSSVLGVRTVLAKDLKINPTFNSLGTFNVTFESKYPITVNEKISLKFENADATIYNVNPLFFKIPCSFYRADGKIENRIENRGSGPNNIIFGLSTFFGFTTVSFINFTISCEKVPFRFLSKTNDVVYSIRVLNADDTEKYPSITPFPKITVNPEVQFNKSVILKKTFVGIGQEADYAFSFSLNPGVAITNTGRINILFTHQVPARLNNDGTPRCFVNKISTTCTFLEDYFLSVLIPANLLITPNVPVGSTVLPVPVMNEVIVSGVKQGNYYSVPSWMGTENHLEYRKEDRIYFAVDSDSNLQNGVSLHDYVKDPFINSWNTPAPKLFNIQGIEVTSVDTQGRVQVTVKFLKKLILGHSIVVKLPKNLQDANLTVSGLNIQINRATAVSDRLFVKGASFIRKGLIKIDLNPDDDYAKSYLETKLSTFPAYVLKFSLDLNFYLPSRKVALTKDKFEFYVVDSISNIILESSLPEINYVEKKLPPQSIPANPTDVVKFLFSSTQTPTGTFVQIIHEATNKCLKKSSTSTLNLINCDVGNVANPNDEFQATLFKLNAVSAIDPTGTSFTIDPTTSVKVEIESKAVGAIKLGMDATTPVNTAFSATKYNYFQLEYARNFASFGNIPSVTICAYADVTASPPVAGPVSVYRAAHTTGKNCLNIVTTATSTTISYAPKATVATSIPAQQFSFRVVSLNPPPEKSLNVEQKIEFIADTINIIWKITAPQAANIFFSIQSANQDVAILGNCNSRYPDKSPFPFQYERDDFGFPIVRFRAPILKLKLCGFLEVSTTSPNLVGKIGYYSDPNYPASGKFSLVTLKMDSITTERVSKIDNPDSHNWYFRNIVSPLNLNIASELTFYDSSKFEKLIYSIPFNSAYGSLRLKAFEKYTISKLSVYLVNLDIIGTDAEKDSFLVPSTPTSTTAFPANLYNFTLTLKGIQSGNYKVILKYVVKPSTTAKRILSEENPIPLKKSDLINQKEIEKHSFTTIRVENSEENSGFINNSFIAFASLIVVLMMVN